MSKTTKYFDLFSALKAGGDKGVSPEALCESLGFSEGMLAVYIHALRTKFGAQVESIRNGRKVSRYCLANIAEMDKAISPNRKPRVSKTPAKAVVTKVARVSKTAKKVLKGKKVRVRDDEDAMAPVLDDMSITEYGSDEMADIRAQLGI